MNAPAAFAWIHLPKYASDLNYDTRTHLPDQNCYSIVYLKQLQYLIILMVYINQEKIKEAAFPPLAYVKSIHAET